MLYEIWLDTGVFAYQEATFFDRKAAEAFCKGIDDQYEAHVTEIHEVPLIDPYGWPFSVAEHYEACGDLKERVAAISVLYDWRAANNI